MTVLGHPWSQNMQTRIENGERDLKLTEAVVLASILGVDVPYFYGDGEATVGDASAIREVRAMQAYLEKRLTELEG